jgi:hypothetical protein
VVYSDGTNTYYFPSGDGDDLRLVYNNADDVLSVFASFGWAKREGATWVLVGDPLARWMTHRPPINL